MGERGAGRMRDVNRSEVEVRDGTVFLIGQVDNFAEKSAAEGGGVSSNRAQGDGDALSIKRSRPASGDETWVGEVRRSLEHDPNKIHRALE